MTWRLFLDDERYPTDKGWIIHRTAQSAREEVMRRGGPSLASFDHDLGDGEDAISFVRWLIEKDLDSDGSLIPRDFRFWVHSQNPVGKANIEGLLNSYLDFKKQS